MSGPAGGGRRQGEAGEGSGTRDRQSQSPPPLPETVTTGQEVPVPPVVVTSSAVSVPVMPPFPAASSTPPHTTTTAGGVTIVVPYKRPRSSTDIQPHGVGAAGASGSGVGGGDDPRGAAQRRKGDLVEVPRGPPLCYVCNRAFSSWKAVFGHMRVHKVGEDRARSGAFPPPVFTPPASPEREIGQEAFEQLAPALLTIAQDLVLTTAASSSSTAAALSATTTTPTPPLALLGIDLNEPQLAPTSSPSPSPSVYPPLPQPQQPPSSPSPPPRSGGFDLNRPSNDDAGDNNA